MNAVDTQTSMIRVRIRELREQRKLTQEDVVFQLNCIAKKHWLTLGTYKNWEKDIKSVNLELLDKLCQLYECGVQDILVRE